MTSTASSSSTTTSLATTTSAAVSSGTNTPSSTSSSPTSSPSSGGGGGSSHTGAIAGGVVGGVLGLALLALLGFFLARRNRNKNAGGAGRVGSGDSLAPEMATAGAAGSQGQPSYVQQQPTGPTVATGGSGGYYKCVI